MPEEILHAHKCVACEKAGKETVWLHDNEKAGDVAAHKCPVCGSIEWRKHSVETKKTEGQAREWAQVPAQQQISSIEMFMYTVLNQLVFVALVTISVLLAFRVQDFIKEKGLPKLPQ
jgi:hypothetical protein